MSITNEADYVSGKKPNQRWNHLSTHYLIASDDNFIVYLDSELDIDWETDEEWDSAGPTDIAAHHAVMNAAALLEATPCSGLEVSAKTQFKRLVGEAIVRSFYHDYASAKEMLNAAQIFVTSRMQETSRRWYLVASFLTSLPFTGFGAAIWINRALVVSVVGQTGLWLTLSAISGVLGALLSVISRMGGLKFECSSGRALHNIEGASRILAGSLYGFLASLAVQSGIVLAPLTTGDHAHSVMVLAALVAGASERFGPSIIESVSRQKVGSGMEGISGNESE